MNNHSKCKQIINKAKHNKNQLAPKKQSFMTLNYWQLTNPLKVM